MSNNKSPQNCGLLLLDIFLLIEVMGGIEPPIRVLQTPALTTWLHDHYYYNNIIAKSL